MCNKLNLHLFLNAFQVKFGGSYENLLYHGSQFV